MDPNGDGYNHAELPFTLPPGFEVASFEDPGLENMATELIGAFGWDTWHVTVANTDGYEMGLAGVLRLQDPGHRLSRRTTMTDKNKTDKTD